MRCADVNTWPTAPYGMSPPSIDEMNRRSDNGRSADFDGGDRRPLVDEDSSEKMSRSVGKMKIKKNRKNENRFLRKFKQKKSEN